MADEKITEKVKGTAKEVAGHAVGDEDLEREGKAQQSKAQASEEAAEKEAEAAKARQEAAGHAGEEKSRQD